ncbi:hypothetical protein OM794_05400 [Halomonas sp. BDJS001]|nr:MULTISPECIES: hypothetical protein [unclassified Halomonas]UZH11196.1 hypothetical protein OM794_05400 [Halomonas sp. BDJS001]
MRKRVSDNRRLQAVSPEQEAEKYAEDSVRADDERCYVSGQLPDLGCSSWQVTCPK